VTPSITVSYASEIVPFVRVGRERWTPRATRYAASKDALAWAVRASVGDSLDAAWRAAPWAVTVVIERRKARGDLDNLVKTVLDACQGILWIDDIQVVELHATIRRGTKADAVTLIAEPRL